jgi:hypothetical protein
MEVIYRMCGIPSSNPSPWDQEDKFKLNKTCLRSFVGAFNDVKPKVHFICDHTEPEIYADMITDVCPFNRKVEFTNLGINDTMLYAYELASRLDDYVILQECDYLYRPKIGSLYLQAMETLGIVSPYDHLNFYIDRNIHSATCNVELIDDYHFRTTERNTMTWGCHSSIIKKNLGVLNKYGYLDDVVWQELRERDRFLWTPLPSFATHCVKGYLSPGVNWEKLYGYYSG